MNTSSQSYLLLASCALVWGLNYAASKVLLATLPPLWLSDFRMATASLALFVVAWLSHERLRITWREAKWLLASGVVGTGANSVLFYLGLRLTTATKASLIMALVPLAAAFMLYLTGQERIGPRHALGAALALCGVSLVLLPGSNLGQLIHHDSGDVLIFFCMLTAAANGLFAKEYLRTLGPISGGAYALGIGVLSVLPFAWMEPTGHIVVNVRIVSLFLYASVIAMAYTTVAWNRALNQVGVGASSLFFNVIPVVALFSDAFFFHASITLASLAGFALTLCGLMLALLKHTPARRRTRSVAGAA